MSNRNFSLSGISSAVRKSRLEGKPSLLPKPRRPGSIDRQSTDAKRPSTTGFRSSSAEPPRPTIGGRLSREASATKLPLNRRSRSQTGGGEAKYDLNTPLRSSQYGRTTATPVRTPSQDRDKLSWQASLERALAFVTIKDQRPINTIPWQRAECARMNEGLAALELGGLIRPLTIARFVEIVNSLLGLITRDAKLNTDNYVAKLPHLTKRLLYPGAVSKSWLRTVNTLHAFPHALALIAYLLDLLMHIRMPISDEWLYISKDEISCLRKEYLSKCWLRFNYESDNKFDDLDEEYLGKFRTLVGYDEQRVAELQQVIKKYKTLLEENEREYSKYREKEAVVASRHAQLTSELKNLRNERSELADSVAAERARSAALADTRRQLAAEIERSRSQLETLQRELAAQRMSVQERDKLLDKLDFDRRVTDSKWAIAEEVSKKLISKENELALWQKRALAGCVQYKQALIQLAPALPRLAALAVDETELMNPECAQHMSRAVSQLQREEAALAATKNERARSKTKLHRRNAQLAEETRVKISEMKAAIEREQQSLETETAAEAAETAAWNREELALQQLAEGLRGEQLHYAQVEEQLRGLQEQEANLQVQVSVLRSQVEGARAQCGEALQRARGRRAGLLRAAASAWGERVERGRGDTGTVE